MDGVQLDMSTQKKKILGEVTVSPKGRWHEQIRLGWERQQAGVLACRVVVR